MKNILRRLVGDDYPDHDETFAAYAQRNSAGHLMELAAIVLLAGAAIIGLIVLAVDVLSQHGM